MENEIKCSINLEWTNKQGAIQRKVTHKLAVLKLIRNASKDMYIEVNPDKSPATQRLHLKNIAIFNKFMQEGKASIKFNDISCSLYISNAPPGQLSTFFRTLFVKIIGYKQDAPKTSLRTQVLTNRTQQYNEISPVTNGELERVIKATTSKSTTTTPSPLASKKRKIERDDDSRAAKKLFASSPLPEELTIEQKEILDACLAGNNIFFTGSAGTGKSYLLKKIIQSLPPDLTMATASTGVAACHIGGTTLHQFAGIGTGEGSLEHCLKLANRSASITWRRCKHLIIDEISMVEGSYFDKIDQVAKAIRKNEKPFGGIQLILCGDFLQLPPVMKASQAKNFCFQTKAWQNCRLMTMELKQVHRQTDNKFISVLNKIRVGQVDDNIVKILKATSSQKIEKDGILATTLCSLTRDVDALNNAKLNELKGETKIFQADDSMVSMSKQLDQLTNIPYKIDLKVSLNSLRKYNLINYSILDWGASNASEKHQCIERISEWGPWSGEIVQRRFPYGAIS